MLCSFSEDNADAQKKRNSNIFGGICYKLRIMKVTYSSFSIC